MVYSDPSSHSSRHGCGKIMKHETKVMWIIQVINLFNILLVVAKIVVSYRAHSFSVANSAIESFGDVFTGILFTIMRSKRCMGGKDRFPRGRATESLTNVIAGVVMLVLAAIDVIMMLEKTVIGKLHASFENIDIGIVGLNVVLKLFLFGVCCLASKEDQIRVLRRDQLTDVVTNICTVLFAFASSYYAIWDVVGALVIALVIMWNWIPILLKNGNRIFGIQVKAEKLSQLIHAVRTHEAVSELHTLTAYHRSEKICVEVVVTFHANIQGRNSLKSALECIEDVEVAYVFTATDEEAKKMKAEENETVEDSVVSAGEESKANDEPDVEMGLLSKDVLSK